MASNSGQSSQQSAAGGEIGVLPGADGGGGTIAFRISPMPTEYGKGEWVWLADQLIKANQTTRRNWSIYGDEVRANMELNDYLRGLPKLRQDTMIKEMGDELKKQYGGIMPTVVYVPTPAPKSQKSADPADISSYSIRQRVYGDVEQRTQDQYPSADVLQVMYQDLDEDYAVLVRYRPEGLPNDGFKYFSTRRLELGESLNLTDWRELVSQGYNHKDDGKLSRLRDNNNSSILMSTIRGGPVPPGWAETLTNDKIYTTTPQPANFTFPMQAQHQDLVNQGLQFNAGNRAVRLEDDDQGNSRWTNEEFFTRVVNPSAMHPAYAAMVSQETVNTFKPVEAPFDTHPSFPTSGKGRSN